MTNKKNGTLYVGVTNNLERRVLEHKNTSSKSFTSKYMLNKLIYYESTDNISVAIERETQLKRWKRAWKIKLIEKVNPQWLEIVLR